MSRRFRDIYGSDARHVLTPTGAKLVRQEIREERQARRTAFVAWAPTTAGPITAIAGLLGVLAILRD